MEPQIRFYLEGGNSEQTILQVDNNWRFETKVVWFEGLESSHNNNVESYLTFFDLNTAFIGLPLPVYRGFISHLKKFPNVRCRINQGNESCYVYHIQKLPALNLAISTSESISIPPQAYTVRNEDKYMIMLASVGTDNQSQLIVNPEYQNSIILGAPFLQNYMIHFTTLNDANAIKIYKLTDIQEDWVLPFFAFLLLVMAAWVGVIVTIVLYKDYKGSVERMNSFRSWELDSVPTSDTSDYQNLEDPNSRARRCEFNWDKCCTWCGFAICGGISALIFPSLILFFWTVV